MGQLRYFREYRNATSPVFVHSRKWALHVAFRFSFILLGLYVANKSGEMVTLAASWAAPEELLTVAWTWALGIAASLTMLACVMVFRSAGPNVDARISETIRMGALREYFGKSPAESESIGKTVAIFESGTASWVRIASQYAIEIPINVASLLAVLAYVFILDPRLLWIALSYVALVGALLLWMEKRISPRKRNRMKINEERSRSFVRSIMEKESAAVYWCRENELRRAEGFEKEMVRAQDSISTIQLPLLRFPQYLLDFAKIATVCFVSYGIAKWTGRIWDAVVVSVAFWFLDKHFQGVLDSYQVCSNEWTNYARLKSFLRGLTDFNNYESWAEYRDRWGEIELRNVEVRYPWSEKTALQDVSVILKKGCVTAIVWKSGAGKTTFLKVVLGFVEPTQWSVLVDGQSLADLRLRTYYEHVWYLSQEPRIFDGSVKENLVYWLAFLPSDADIERVLDESGCDFVRDFPNGIEEAVGEKWTRLSGWQKQRMAIARILLRKSSIVILDEPTSFLDQFSEEKVMETIMRAFRWKTVIVVSHRMKIAAAADEILVIDRGRVIEKGTHSSLMKEGGAYSAMTELQSRAATFSQKAEDGTFWQKGFTD